MPIIQDDIIAHAISNLRRRSERQDDIEKLRSSFVDVGILQQLRNSDNQIIYGRRGTGKTHILKVLASEATGSDKAVGYIDFRTLGSTAQFSDNTLSIRRRCTSLFRDILAYVHDALMEHILNRSGTLSETTGLLMDHFADAAISEISSYFDTSVTVKRVSTDEEQGKLQLSAEPAPKLSVGFNERRTDQFENTATAQVTHDDKVVFPSVNALLRRILQAEALQLLLLLDEWSSLPWDVQPYMAEFLKRSFFANGAVTVKVASLEQRSNFTDRTPSGIVGFEVGSDISAALDIDDYYVFEKDPESVTAVFADILFRHLTNELPYHYLEARYGAKSGMELAEALCDSIHTFYELARASQGVARDLINICSASFFAASRKRQSRIGIQEVHDTARKWFEQDKASNLGSEDRRLVDALVSLLVARRGLYSFVLPVENEKQAAIQRLVDARVVHLINRGTSDEDNPGIRYSVFCLDYGAYVHLLGTAKQPELGFRRGTNLSHGRQMKKFILPRDILGEQ